LNEVDTVDTNIYKWGTREIYTKIKHFNIKSYLIIKAILFGDVLYQCLLTFHIIGL